MMVPVVVLAWTTDVCVTVVVGGPAVIVEFWYTPELDEEEEPEEGPVPLERALELLPALVLVLEVVLGVVLGPVLDAPPVVVGVVVVVELDSSVAQGSYTTWVVVAQPRWQHGADTVTELRGRPVGTQEHGTVTVKAWMHSACTHVAVSVPVGIGGHG